MSTTKTAAWLCSVCGYVHQGEQPPDYCPVCGTPASDFEPYAAPAAAAAVPAASHWQCLACGYLHEGAEAPDCCPVCAAGRDRFEPLAEPTPGPAASQAGHLLIVGGGIAGVSAAEAARQAAPKWRITLIRGEAHLPYYRLNLTRYLAGEIGRDALPIHPGSWFADHDIELIEETRVAGLDPESHSVALVDGRQLIYDRLVLTMGAHAFIPPLPGVALPGVVPLRTVADADAILERAWSKPACVIVGGGVLGLEAAGALARRGLPVTLLESHQWLMPRQLNRRGGEILAAHLATLGISLRLEARTQQFLGEDCLAGVKLVDGAILPAELAVVATGVRPDTYLARKAGLEVNRGIVVDNHLRTSAADVYAAGDVAEHHGVLYGVWGPSQYQGSIAGLNAVGVETAFGGVPRANALKVLGLDLLSIGQFEPEDGSYWVVADEPAGKYRHFVFHDGRLVGCILLGEGGAALAAKKAIEGKRDFSALLAGNPSATEVLAAL